MVCHNLASQLRAIERVVEAVNSGQITRHAVQTSAKRVRSLKTKYLILDNCSKPNMASKIEAPNVKISELASRIYAQSTTLIRSSPSSLPWDPKVTTAMVFLYYEQQWYGNGAVESGEGNTKDASSASLYTKLINKHIDGIITITYHENTPLTSSAKTQIDQANLVILTTRNASQSPFQKELGLSLGKQLGEKLVVIATCDPYDFLEESQHIKNYISTYEPTLPAFKSAIDIIFGDAKPQGTLPVGGYRPAHEITQGSRSDLDKVWHMWQYIFSDWAIDRLHLQAILSDPSARLYIHDKGFCIAFFVTYGVAKVAIIGVVPNSRKQGVGTALVKHTRESMNLECSFLSFGTGSVFPRLWPGVPTSFAQSSRDFFIHRGWFSMCCNDDCLLMC
jgi:beta-N-acetylhexosaminidase